MEANTCLFSEHSPIKQVASQLDLTDLQAPSNASRPSLRGLEVQTAETRGVSSPARREAVTDLFSKAFLDSSMHCVPVDRVRGRELVVCELVRLVSRVRGLIGGGAAVAVRRIARLAQLLKAPLATRAPPAASLVSALARTSLGPRLRTPRRPLDL